MEYSKIYLESCMDTMKRIGDKEIDLIVTSPPYNLLGKVTKGKIVKRSEGSAIGIAKKYADFERGIVNDVWTDIKNNKQYTGTHSAGMPIDLAVKLIDRFSKPGELVYDPFMGTGTTAIASILTGRKWIGSEISEKYFMLSLERIENFKKENGI